MYSSVFLQCEKLISSRQFHTKRSNWKFQLRCSNIECPDKINMEENEKAYHLFLFLFSFFLVSLLFSRYSINSLFFKTLHIIFLPNCVSLSFCFTFTLPFFNISRLSIYINQDISISFPLFHDQILIYLSLSTFIFLILFLFFCFLIVHLLFPRSWCLFSLSWPRIVTERKNVQQRKMHRNQNKRILKLKKKVFVKEKMWIIVKM